MVRSLVDAVTDEDLQKLSKRVDSDGDGQLQHQLEQLQDPRNSRSMAAFVDEKFSLGECWCLIKTVDGNGYETSLLEF